MKRSIINVCALLAISGLVALSSRAQTSAKGSASGGASITPGQAGASANAGVQAGVLTNANPSGALKSGTTMQAELNKSVDAKKAKAGDEVSANLTQDVKVDGKVVLRSGAKLIGHVTQAQAHTKEHADSQLGIVFDQALPKGGEKVSFNGVIRAVAPPVQPAISMPSDESTGMSAPAPMGGGAPVPSSSSGGARGGATSTVAGATNAAGGAVNRTVGGATGGLSANGTLSSASQGVIGMQGLTLNSGAAAGAQGSVISSTSQTVRLESGTQMILQVAGLAQ